LIRNIQTVLLVEDNVDEEFLSVRGLSKFKCPLHVTVARDGDRALRILETYRPDLIICDLDLPKISGDQVLANVRANSDFDLVPIVMFTSSDEASDVKHCKALGANGYVQKPVDYETYLSRVNDIVSLWLGGPRMEDEIAQRLPNPFALPSWDRFPKGHPVSQVA
jgi:two-component system response regulator